MSGNEEKARAAGCDGYRVKPLNDDLLFDKLILKVASLIGETFDFNLLQAVYPIEADKAELPAHLEHLMQLDLIAPLVGSEQSFYFKDIRLCETASQLMLFAQRRHLHRAIAEWYEAYLGDRLSNYYPLLARHWREAEDPAKTIAYLEKAGEQARREGNIRQALNYYHEALSLEVQDG